MGDKIRNAKLSLEQVQSHGKAGTQADNGNVEDARIHGVTQLVVGLTDEIERSIDQAQVYGECENVPVESGVGNEEPLDAPFDSMRKLPQHRARGES